MIDLKSVDVRLGGQRILADFSHAFASGSFTLVTGPSGIGKTTLLRTIAGLLPIEAGTVQILGRTTDRPGFTVHPADRQLGFVFQSPALWPHLTVRQNILYGVPRRLPAFDAEKRLGRLCEALGIRSLLRQHPGELSGGQARRVSLARTLITEPAILLLDEPFNHLDRSLKADVLALLAEFRQTPGRTVLLVSHEPEDLQPLADQTLTFRPDGLG
jgi:ABC-type sugar transport system ATPase subunit